MGNIPDSEGGRGTIKPFSLDSEDLTLDWLLESVNYAFVVLICSNFRP